VRLRQRYQAVLAGIAVAVCALSLAAQTGNQFKARLSMAPVDFVNRDGTTGLGAAQAVLAGNKVTITGSFQGLSSPATVAQVHRGVARGVPGPSVAELKATKAVNGTIEGSLDLTPSQVDDLKHGRLYIQLNSEKQPEGTLWGWLLQ